MSEREAGRPYRFDELGWLQFERLCQELLALSADVDRKGWSRDSRACSVVVPDGVVVPGVRRRLAGPTLVLVVWARPSAAPSEGLNAIIEQTLAGWVAREPRSVLALTNVASSDAVDATVLGARELTALVAGSPALRLRVPTVLGIGAADLVIPAAADASTADLAAARALAPVFVPTRAYEVVVEVLERHHFVVLTGPPEMGKTAIARTIGLASLTAGWEVHECIRPDELWARYRRGRRQVFIADDAFGSTEYRPEAAERWALELDRVLRAMDDEHRLLWTSRPAPFKAGLRRIHREHGIEHFPRPAQVQVDATDLDVAEKALILFRHAKAASLPAEAVELVKAEGWTIVGHPHFTPERIRRFVSNRLVDLSARAASRAELEAAVAAELREPTDAMTASFRALSDPHRALLVALLDTSPAPVGERELAAAFRRHGRAGLGQHPGELVDRLTDHFLRLVDGGAVTWVHPSWRDLVIEQLSADAAERERFLRASALDGLLLALSTAGGVEGERHLPLLHEDRDWDAAGDRLAELIPELEGPDLTRLFVALGEAGDASDDQTRWELNYLLETVLGLVARRWSHERRPVSIGVLQSWLRLAASCPTAPPLPELTGTWVELVPTSAFAFDVREERIRFDDWTSLCEVLASHAPQILAAFGFPEQQREVIESFVSAAETADLAALPPAQRELLRPILRRLSRLGVTDPVRAANAAARLATVRDEPELPEVYPRRRISAELRDLLNASLIHSDQALVTRVLRDL